VEFRLVEWARRLRGDTGGESPGSWANIRSAIETVANAEAASPYTPYAPSPPYLSQLHELGWVSDPRLPEWLQVPANDRNEQRGPRSLSRRGYLRNELCRPSKLKES
jgi:hypothetical protein